MIATGALSVRVWRPTDVVAPSHPPPGVRALTDALRDAGFAVNEVHDRRAAAEALFLDTWSALIVHTRVNGWDDLLRNRSPDTAALICTDSVSEQLCNDALRLKAGMLVDPNAGRNACLAVAYLQRCCATPDLKLMRTIRSHAAELALTGAESHLLHAGVRGFAYREIANLRSSSVATVKSQVHALLDKMSACSFHAASARVCSHAFGFSMTPPARRDQRISSGRRGEDSPPPTGRSFRSSRAEESWPSIADCPPPPCRGCRRSRISDSPSLGD